MGMVSKPPEHHGPLPLTRNELQELEDQKKRDPIVEAVRQKLLDRSHLGVKKYGVTLADSPQSTLEFLVHAQEEAMDTANYLELLIQREQARLRQAALDQHTRDVADRQM